MDDRAERIAKLSSLTPRQREVLQLIGQNLTNKEIKQRLKLTEAAVFSHVMQIYSKLGLSEPDQDGKIGRNMRQRELAAYAHDLYFLDQEKTSQNKSFPARSFVRDEQANTDDEEHVAEGLTSAPEDEPRLEVLANTQIIEDYQTNSDGEEVVTEGLTSASEDEPRPEVLAIIRLFEAVTEDGYGFTKPDRMLFLSRRTWLLLLLVATFLLFSFIAVTKKDTPQDNNIAPQATVTASSYHVDKANLPNCFAPENVVDGNILDRGRCVEWASKNDAEGVWINLEFGTARSIRKIILYDRQNPDDHVLHGKLDFGNDAGSIIHSEDVPELLNNGQPVEITLSKTVVAKWVRLTIDTYVGPFVGLSEIKVIE